MNRLPNQEEIIRNTIDVIHKVRKDLIKDFLDDRVLIQYLASQFRVVDLSRIKIELIKADLRKLLITPIDSDHYQPVLAEYDQTSMLNEALFYKEIVSLLKKYIF